MYFRPSHSISNRSLMPIIYRLQLFGAIPQKTFPGRSDARSVVFWSLFCELSVSRLPRDSAQRQDVAKIITRLEHVSRFCENARSHELREYLSCDEIASATELCFEQLREKQKRP